MFFRKSLKFYRGPQASDLKSELFSITNSLEHKDEKKRTIADHLKELKEPSFTKPFLCVGVLYMTYNFAGFNTASSYAKEFLDNSGRGIWNPAEEAVVLASFKFFMSLLSPFILLCVPKKTLFVSLSITSALAFLFGNW